MAASASPSTCTFVARTLLLSLFAGVACARVDTQKNATDTLLYRVGYAHVHAVHRAPARLRSVRIVALEQPGPDREPEGFTIYDHMKDVPDYDIQPGDAEPQKCFVETRKFCVRATFCGHVCEPILLAVKSYCKKTVRVTTLVDGCKEKFLPGMSCQRVDQRIEWRPCEKARKYNRCFPKICYKKFLVQDTKRDPDVSVPAAHTVRSHQSVVRYKKPLPLHEVRAMKSNQSTARSAIFGKGYQA